MNLQYKELLPTDFAPNSRVWIFQCNRLFSLSEALQVEDILNDLAANWMSHGAKVKAYANLFFGRFIVLMADESNTTVGGCSTDSFFRIIKQIEAQFKVDLFDRQLLAFLIRDKIELLPLSQLEYAVQNNFVNQESIYFNNTVPTKQELENNWMIPVKKSWLSKKFPQLQPL